MMAAIGKLVNGKSPATALDALTNTAFAAAATANGRLRPTRLLCSRRPLQMLRGGTAAEPPGRRLYSLSYFGCSLWPTLAWQRAHTLPGRIL